MSTFFISDTHFGESDIIRYENRPFDNPEQMNAILIDNWNSIVRENDTVYHLGDIGHDDIDLRTLLSQLNGEKYLIKGNHDTKENDFYRKAGFKEVYDHPIIFQNFYLLSHEPLYVNINMPYANIFGHIHNNPMYQTASSRSYCVCVERIRYTPILLESMNRSMELYSLHQPRKEDNTMFEFLKKSFSKENAENLPKNYQTFLYDPDKFFNQQIQHGADPDVIQFIIDILLHNGKDMSECTRSLFRSGYCYYFAHILKTAFRRGTVCWAAPYGHFVWCDEDNTPYDIEGLYFGEAIEFIPEHYLGDAIYDFLHIKSLSYNASTEDIDRIIKTYRDDKQKGSISMDSKYAEIRTNYTDEKNVICIDAWKTIDDNEEGTIIAKIHIDTKTVEYLDNDARYDDYAQEEIKAILATL